MILKPNALFISLYKAGLTKTLVGGFRGPHLLFARSYCNVLKGVAIIDSSMNCLKMTFIVNVEGTETFTM